MCHNTPEGSGDEASNLTCLAKFDLPHGRGASPYGVASFQGFKVCVCGVYMGGQIKCVSHVVNSSVASCGELISCLELIGCLMW